MQSNHQSTSSPSKQIPGNSRTASGHAYNGALINNGSLVNNGLPGKHQMPLNASTVGGCTSYNGSLINNGGHAYNGAHINYNGSLVNNGLPGKHQLPSNASTVGGCTSYNGSLINNGALINNANISVNNCIDRDNHQQLIGNLHHINDRVGASESESNKNDATTDSNQLREDASFLLNTKGTGTGPSKTTNIGHSKEVAATSVNAKGDKVDFPSGLIPYHRSHIDEAHAKTYFKYYKHFTSHPDFDNDFRKQHHEHGIHVEYDKKYGKNFVTILKKLHQLIFNQGKIIFDNYVTDQFKAAGFKMKNSSQAASTAKDCKAIIGSEAAKLASKDDPLFMLRLTYEHVHNAGNENSSFYTQSLMPEIMLYMSEKYPMFTFEERVPNPKERGSRKKKILHNIIKIASSGTAQIRKSFQDAEMKHLHMSVRTCTKQAPGDYLVPVDLSPDSDGWGESAGTTRAYIAVKKCNFPDIRDWSATGVHEHIKKYIEADKTTRAAYRFARTILSNGKTEQDGVESFRNTMRTLSGLIGPAESGSAGVITYSPSHGTRQQNVINQQSQQMNHDPNNSNVNQHQGGALQQQNMFNQQNQQMNHDPNNSNSQHQQQYCTTQGQHYAINQQSQQMNNDPNNYNVNQHQGGALQPQYMFNQQNQQMNHDPNNSNVVNQLQGGVLQNFNQNQHSFHNQQQQGVRCSSDQHQQQQGGGPGLGCYIQQQYANGQGQGCYNQQQGGFMNESREMNEQLGIESVEDLLIGTPKPFNGNDDDGGITAPEKDDDSVSVTDELLGPNTTTMAKKTTHAKTTKRAKKTTHAKTSPENQRNYNKENNGVEEEKKKKNHNKKKKISTVKDKAEDPSPTDARDRGVLQGAADEMNSSKVTVEYIYLFYPLLLTVLFLCKNVS